MFKLHDASHSIENIKGKRNKQISILVSKDDLQKTGKIYESIIERLKQKDKYLAFNHLEVLRSADLDETFTDLTISNFKLLSRRKNELLIANWQFGTEAFTFNASQVFPLYTC